MLTIRHFITIAFICSAINSYSQEQIPYSVISSAGGLQSNSGNIINGTLGEIYIENSTNSSNQLSGGFWQIYKHDIITSFKEDFIAPLEFRLEQNYPNPFNPVTTISWQSPVGSHQILKVYDVLGNEVATLVDEFREAGRYEVEFSTVGMKHASSTANELSSGVYFYQLKAGDYIQTKKMIVLK